LSNTQKIIAHCIIHQNTIYKNGDCVFESKESDAGNFLLAAYKELALNYPRFYKIDNLGKLGILATEILLKNSFNKEQFKPYETAVVLSNASASLDTDIKYYETVANIASPALFVYTLPNVVIGEICIKHGFKGENAFFIFDNFDEAFTEQYVNNLFETAEIKACICGWLELMNEEYKAVLFLVQRSEDDLVDFTKENIYKIYQTANGKI